MVWGLVLVRGCLLEGQLRGVVPMAEHKRDPDIEPQVLEKKLVKQELQILRANQRISTKRTLPSLVIRQPVLAQDMRAYKTQWDRGTCVGWLSNQSYVVDIDDQLVRRNCRFLKPTENWPSCSEEALWRRTQQKLCYR